jgi:hypothetical protein
MKLGSNWKKKTKSMNVSARKFKGAENNFGHCRRGVARRPSAGMNPAPALMLLVLFVLVIFVLIFLLASLVCLPA